MDREQFVGAIKSVIYDHAASGLLSCYRKPPGRNPSKSLLEISAWFNSLSEDDQQMISRVIQDAVHHSTFGFFCVLDGVRAIEGYGPKGDLELYYVKNGDKVRLNGPNGEELHDLFNGLVSVP